MNIDKPVMTDPEMKTNEFGHVHFHNPGEQEGLPLMPVNYCERYPDACFDFPQSSWISRVLFGDEKNKNYGKGTVKKDVTIVGQKRKSTGWKEPKITTKSKDGKYHMDGGRHETLVTVVLPPGVTVDVEKPHTSEGRSTIRAGSYFYEEGYNSFKVHNSNVQNEIVF